MLVTSPTQDMLIGRATALGGSFVFMRADANRRSRNIHIEKIIMIFTVSFLMKGCIKNFHEFLSIFITNDLLIVFFDFRPYPIVPTVSRVVGHCPE